MTNFPVVPSPPEHKNFNREYDEAENHPAKQENQSRIDCSHINGEVRRLYVAITFRFFCSISFPHSIHDSVFRQSSQASRTEGKIL